MTETGGHKDFKSMIKFDINAPPQTQAQGMGEHGTPNHAGITPTYMTPDFMTPQTMYNSTGAATISHYTSNQGYSPIVPINNNHHHHHQHHVQHPHINTNTNNNNNHHQHTTQNANPQQGHSTNTPTTPQQQHQGNNQTPNMMQRQHHQATPTGTTNHHQHPQKMHTPSSGHHHHYPQQQQQQQQQQQKPMSTGTPNTHHVYHKLKMESPSTATNNHHHHAMHPQTTHNASTAISSNTTTNQRYTHSPAASHQGYHVFHPSQVSPSPAAGGHFHYQQTQQTPPVGAHHRHGAHHHPQQKMMHPTNTTSPSSAASSSTTTTTMMSTSSPSNQLLTIAEGLTISPSIRYPGGKGNTRKKMPRQVVELNLAMLPSDVSFDDMYLQSEVLGFSKKVNDMVPIGILHDPKTFHKQSDAKATAVYNDCILRFSSHSHGQKLAIRWTLFHKKKPLASIDSATFQTITERGLKKKFARDDPIMPPKRVKKWCLQDIKLLIHCLEQYGIDYDAIAKASTSWKLDRSADEIEEKHRHLLK